MSITNIPAKVRNKLWARAAGRCEYRNCNVPLWEDIVTKAQFSIAYIAHIIAEKPGGARYDAELSDKLKYDFSNLMLLCDSHHRLIDLDDVEGHPVELLREMKQAHEERIALQTALSEESRSHILHYGANIGTLKPFVTWAQSKAAMSPLHYPAESNAIEISFQNSSFIDADADYWSVEQQNLRRHFATKVRDRLGKDIKHLSVFAIAPQPLLIELGRLISDVSGTDVYQHQKEPIDNWKWSEPSTPCRYEVIRPVTTTDMVALNLSLSATIDNARIWAVLGEDATIWTLTIKDPFNDFLKSRSQLNAFRESFRKLLNEIKTVHGQNQVIHVFPAVPVAIAIEVGRVWMPKADLPLVIYDQNSRMGGFVKALNIESS